MIASLSLAEPVRVYLWEDLSVWDAGVVRRVVAWAVTAPLGQGPWRISMDDGDTWTPFDAGRLTRALSRTRAVVRLRGPQGEVAWTRRPKRAGVMVKWTQEDLAALGMARTVDAIVALAEILPGFTWGKGQACEVEVVRWAQSTGQRPLPEVLGEFPGWLHLVSPKALVSCGISAERLLGAPCARAWTTGMGVLVVHTFDDLAAIAAPEGLDRLAAFVRHLTP